MINSLSIAVDEGPPHMAKQKQNDHDDDDELCVKKSTSNNVNNNSFVYYSYTFNISLYEQDLVLNNPQELRCPKTKQNIWQRDNWNT